MTTLATDGKVGQDALCLVRTFDAPLDLVFGVWAEPEHMKHWLGPRDWICTSCTLDFRPGGRWRACIVSPEKKESWMGGVYREIVANARLVFTFAWEGGRDQPGVDQLVTVTFSEHRGRTTQTFHQAPFLREEARDQHIGGWTQVFDKEETYLATLAKGGDE